MLDFEKRVSVNLIPVVATVKMFSNNFVGINIAIYNVIGNILLFIPLGFGIPLFFSNKNKIGKVIAYGFIASLTIEVLQYFTSRNITDVNVDINSDIYSIFSGEESKDLKIEFYDDNGDIYKDMKFERYKDEGQSN